MTWYQTISVLLSLYLFWDFFPLVYAIIHKGNLTVSVWYRVFAAIITTNLILSFTGTPW